MFFSEGISKEKFKLGEAGGRPDTVLRHLRPYFLQRLVLAEISAFGVELVGITYKFLFKRYGKIVSGRYGKIPGHDLRG